MPVIFAGFRSDTYALQQAGWRLAVEEDVYSGVVRMMMHHPGAELYLVARDWRMPRAHMDLHTRFMHDFMTDRPEFVVERVARSLESYRVNLDFSKFLDIDATPQYVDTPIRSIRDFKLFANPLVRTEEIIVEPQSVAECLDLIRKLQSPDLERIRQANRARGDAINRQNFHAQIITMAA
jgi:hypothetical protein